MTAPNELSFLPDDYLERKAQARTNAICAVLFLCVMGGILLAFLASHRAMGGLTQQQLLVDRQYSEAARRIEQVRQMQDKQRKMAHQAELTSSLIEKLPRSYVLAEITNGLPDGVSLLECIMDSKVRQAASSAKDNEPRRLGPAPAKPQESGAEAKRYDVAMKLTGVAHTDVQVAQFITRLSRSKLLRDVNLVISDEYTQGEQKLRKFQIDMMLVADTEVNPSTLGQIRSAALDPMAH